MLARTAAVLAAYLFSHHSLLRLKLTRLSGALFFDILRVGAVGALSTLHVRLLRTWPVPLLRLARMVPLQPAKQCD